MTYQACSESRKVCYFKKNAKYTNRLCIEYSIVTVKNSLMFMLFDVKPKNKIRHNHKVNEMQFLVVSLA